MCPPSIQSLIGSTQTHRRIGTHINSIFHGSNIVQVVTICGISHTNTKYKEILYYRGNVRMSLGST
jgi:hypothetical protein